VRLEVGDLVLGVDGQWMVRPPERCGAGHLLRGHCLVGSMICLCQVRQPDVDVQPVRRHGLRAGARCVLQADARARRGQVMTPAAGLEFVDLRPDVVGNISWRPPFDRSVAYEHPD
jgi:hypothetical protein